MSGTVKLLVVANRTAESADLFEALIERAELDDIAVTLVAPASLGAGIITGASATRERLDRAIARLREAGVTVKAIVGDHDPLVAVSDIWDRRKFDEVTVVTLPSGTSKWLAMDLPASVERLTGADVTHIVAGVARRRMARAV